MMMRYLLSLIVSSIICLAAFPLYAEYHAGFGALYSYMQVEEHNGDSNKSNPYFTENDISKRSVVGIYSYFQRNVKVNTLYSLAFGPYLEVGKLNIYDEQPTGFSAEGGMFYSVGGTLKLLIRTFGNVFPYIQAGLGYEWSSIDWSADVPVYIGSDQQISYTEDSFGYSTRLMLGAEFNPQTTIGFFAEAGIVYGWFSSNISGTHQDLINDNNKYLHRTLRVSIGVFSRFK